MENIWNPFESIVWNDVKITKFNIDTRNFATLCITKLNEKPPVLKSKEKFLYTFEEMKELIERLYKQSGGKGEWRYLDLEVNDSRLANWGLKYIRIWVTDDGYIVCNKDDKPLPKDIMVHAVEQDHLNFH